MQCRRETGIDAGLHRLLWLGGKTAKAKAGRLRRETLEARLLLLLLLLDAKLRLGLEPRRLRRQSVLELILGREAGYLGLEALLVQFGQALSRGSDRGPRLRDAGQLGLQWSSAKGVRRLGEILRRRQRSGWGRREERALAHGLRSLWAGSGRRLQASRLGTEPLRLP